METNLNGSGNFCLKMVSEMDEQYNDSLPWHPLPYCYVNIVRAARAVFLVTF